MGIVRTNDSGIDQYYKELAKERAKCVFEIGFRNISKPQEKRSDAQNVPIYVGDFIYILPDFSKGEAMHLGRVTKIENQYVHYTHMYNSTPYACKPNRVLVVGADEVKRTVDVLKKEWDENIEDKK